MMVFDLNVVKLILFIGLALLPNVAECIGFLGSENKYLEANIEGKIYAMNPVLGLGDYQILRSTQGVVTIRLTEKMPRKVGEIRRLPPDLESSSDHGLALWRELKKQLIGDCEPKKVVNDGKCKDKDTSDECLDVKDEVSGEELCDWKDNELVIDTGKPEQCQEVFSNRLEKAAGGDRINKVQVLEQGKKVILYRRPGSGDDKSIYLKKTWDNKYKITNTEILVDATNSPIEVGMYLIKPQRYQKENGEFDFELVKDYKFRFRKSSRCWSFYRTIYLMLLIPAGYLFWCLPSADVFRAASGDNIHSVPSIIIIIQWVLFFVTGGLFTAAASIEPKRERKNIGESQIIEYIVPEENKHHHCPFLDNIIGKGNFQWWILLIIFGWLTCLFLLITVPLSIYRFHVQKNKLQYAGMVLSYPVTIGFLIFLLRIFFFI